MNKTIKFRAWDPEVEVMIESEDLSESGYLINPDIGNITLIDGDVYETKLIPMQFTGLLDQNGKEIYEGDILKMHHFGNRFHHHWVGYAEQRASFYAMANDQLRPPGQGEYNPGTISLDIYSRRKDFEIVGNIYENPELLESAK